MDPVSAIFTVAQQIAKAAVTARRNRTRCRELAERARTVGDILRDSSVPKAKAAASGGDTASRRSALDRLKVALDDARELVKSCQRQSGSFFSWLTSARTAARFRAVETRIDRCVGELGIANDARILELLNDLASRRNSTSAGSKKETNRNKAKKKDVAKNGNNKSEETNRNKAKKKDVAKNGNNKSEETNRNKAKKKDVAKNGNNKSGSTAAAVGNTRKKGGSQMRGKAAAAVPPQRYVVHSMEDDPNSCSVM